MNEVSSALVDFFSFTLIFSKTKLICDGDLHKVLVYHKVDKIINKIFLVLIKKKVCTLI